MAASEIKEKFQTVVDATISLASIANGAGRISAQIDNTTIRAPLVHIYWRIRSGGTAPAAGLSYLLYLIKSDAKATGEHIDEGLGTADAAVSTKPNAADPVAVITTINTANQMHYGSAVIYNPGPKFSLLFWNDSGQTIHATGTDHYVRYILSTPEAQ